jgi:hypothetical protein
VPARNSTGVLNRIWKGRLALVLAAVALTMAVATSALAVNVVYANHIDVPSNTWATSGIANIKGGFIESCGACGVEIRTTLSWSPYYTLVSGKSQGSVSISHGVQNSSRSRCSAWLAGTVQIYCYYVK